MSCANESLSSSACLVDPVKSFLPSVSELVQTQVSQDEIYYAVLKVVLLEYINQPRFRKKFQKIEKITCSGPSAIEKLYFKGKDSEKRLSRFKNSQTAGTNEAIILKKMLPILEKTLTSITVGEYKIANDIFRRCLLKLYNDLFLDPAMANLLEYMDKPEELIMIFTKAASGEILKLDIEATRGILYELVTLFIDFLISLLDLHELSDQEFVLKLRSYADSFKPEEGNNHSFRQRNQPGNGSELGVDIIDVTIKPTYKTSEILLSGYIRKLFAVTEAQFEQDVALYKDKASNINYLYELKNRRDGIISETVGFTSNHFPSDKAYNDWKVNEINSLDELISKIEDSDSSNICETTIDISFIIPPEPNVIFTRLMCLILEQERPSITKPMSADGQSLISRCGKIWRLDLYSTKASIYYTAANLTLCPTTNLDTETIDYILRTALPNMSDNYSLDSDPTTWNSEDQNRWLVNLNHTYIQCMSSLSSLLANIYKHEKAIFSPVLSIYYDCVESDPLMIQYDFPSTDFHNKWVKNLKQTLSKATEIYYVSLLQDMPNEDHLEIHHLQQLGSLILQKIKKFQGRYPKPLLNKINLSREVASQLISAFASDSPLVLQRIEERAAFLKQDIPVMDAIETYTLYQELRDVFHQVTTKKFPFALEKHFFKHISKLCDETRVKLEEVIQNSLKAETWEPVSNEVHYSSSVLDIIRMINESIQLFQKLNWGNEYQVAKIKTFLLKTFSDGICYYASKIVSVIEEDLTHVEAVVPADDTTYEYTGSFQSTAEKMKNTWLFDEIKNALTSAPLEEPPVVYEFKARTCVCLNNLDELMNKITELEETINVEKISQTIKLHEKAKTGSKKGNKEVNQVYTIRIVKAENVQAFTSDGYANSAVSLVDTSIRQEFAKTKVVRKTVNPIWDEVFELVVPNDETRVISATVWHHSQKLNPIGSYKVCGKCSLLLDSRSFNSDGYTEDIVLDLDTQGRLFLQVSLESEKIDAMFCVGRAYRSLSRACDRAIGMMVNKFSTYVNYSISRPCLKAVCASTSNSNASQSKEVIYDAIVPLFDYLNSNLEILAAGLTRSLLHKVMIKAWNSILNMADSLLLPNLSSARSVKTALTNKGMSLWENAISIAKGNTNELRNITGNNNGQNGISSQAALSNREVEIIFEWLRALCIDFFHNGGEGPPLHELKNQHYQNILLVPVFYDKSVDELKEETEALIPLYEKYLDNRNYYDFTRHGRQQENSRRRLQRSDTIIAHSSKEKRAEAAAVVRELRSDPLEISAVTQDIILRILLAKGQSDYVSNFLNRRSELAKAVATRKLVKAAVAGSRHIKNFSR
ncbi:HBL015Cp [Eremothecium sinecaudum]|uniref:HBL015Cp n=1 Tax=Eremothecium sinecaudum TaxID=45286 RepID=A0A120K107_9SACH|nr:HBL015Cp [Eremothecium sinecaudum]AMD18887.1 HBL015Cp [Eremothecium sinecaudum]